MKSQSGGRFVLIVGGAALLLVVSWITLTLSEKEPAGGEFVDLGTVLLDTGASSVNHVATFINDSGQPMTLTDWVVSCGCLRVTFTDQTGQPSTENPRGRVLGSGERLDIDITVAVESPGTRTERLSLIFDDATMHNVEVQVTGRKSTEFRGFVTGVSASDHLVIALHYSAGADDREAPPPISVLGAKYQVTGVRWVGIGANSIGDHRFVGRAHLQLADGAAEWPASVRLQCGEVSADVPISRTVRQ